MTTTTDKTIDIGSVNIIEAVFRGGSGNSHGRLYLLQAPGSKTDYIDVLTRFPSESVKRTTEFYIDDTEGQWFAFANADCFDPPIAIIRAGSFEAAYEVFCNEFEKWIWVDASDSADYPEDERHYNDQGTHIDTDNVQGFELTLLRAVVEHQ